MATHNQVRIIGVLRGDPIVKNKGIKGEEKIHIVLRTHLNKEKADKAYTEGELQDLVVYFDNENSQLWSTLLELKQYDIVDIKGVVNILEANKPSMCPHCESINVRQGSTFFAIYPISCYKLHEFQNANNQSPAETMLVSKYLENSNQALIIGKLTRDPEPHQRDGVDCCRYPVSVERKYYIATQDHVHPTDCPWVYSFGKQMVADLEYLKVGAEVLIDGFIRTTVRLQKTKCENCNSSYEYKDVISDIVPYRTEYLSGQYKRVDINPDPEE